MPVRDAADTLDECLGSILDQTLRDLEVVVLDDGSTDGTAEGVAAWAAADPRVRLIRRPPRGIVASLNEAVALAGAPLIARMDADDRMHPRRLESQVAYLEARAEVAVVGCLVRAFPEERVGVGTAEYLRWQNSCVDPTDMAEEIYVEVPITHPSATLRRGVFEGIGGYRQGPFPEDYDLWLRLVSSGERLGKVPEVLLDWRQSADSLSRRDPRYDRSAFDRLRAGYLARDPRLAADRPLAIWGAGRRTRLRVRHLLERGHAPSLWVDVDPRKTGRSLDGVPVVGPDALDSARVTRRPFVLVYVASHGARDLIGATLRSMGYQRGRDYLMVG